MSNADTGQCPYCNAVNSYHDTHCVQCSEELPWANWVQARSQTSSAPGAKRGDFTARGGQSVSEGFALPAGAGAKLFLLIIAFAAFLLIFRVMSPVFRAASPNAAGNRLGNSAIVDQFQRANPLEKQEKDLQKEER